jgi:toxin ParE1/3/4
MAGVEWSDRARISLRGIANDIARDAARPAVADKLVDAIHAKAEAHGRQPGMGSWHKDLPETYRYFVHKRYVVIYEELDDGIRVLLVVDSARDWTRMFE